VDEGGGRQASAASVGSVKYRVGLGLPSFGQQQKMTEGCWKSRVVSSILLPYPHEPYQQPANTKAISQKRLGVSGDFDQYHIIHLLKLNNDRTGKMTLYYSLVSTSIFHPHV